MEKVPRTGSVAQGKDALTPEDGRDDELFVKGPEKGSLKNMHKNADDAYSKGLVDVALAAPEPVDRFDGDGYSIRRLSREESREAGLLGYEPQIVARQDSTEEFLTFLNSIPADDDLTLDARPTPNANP